jgi:hypothetical protein
MDDRKDYTKGFICIAVAGVFLLFAFFSLPAIIISPQKFTLFFTISMLSLICALAFLNGPATYAKKLTERKNIVATGVMVTSIILSLYFSVIQSSYLLSLLFCIIEVRNDPIKDFNSSTQYCYSFAILSQQVRQV